MATSVNGQMLALAVKAALDGKPTLKSYLIETEGKSEHEVAALIAAAKQELEDD